MACNAAITHDKEIQEKAGITHGYTDFLKWVEFYSTPMKNCMVAALNLPRFPHQQRHSVLNIQITHKGDATLPLEHRFTIESISRNNRGEDGFASTLGKRLDSTDMRKTIEFGKVEMGDQYYGTATILILAVFSTNPFISIPVFKTFSIDKTVASANVTPIPWWTPLRYIMENGKKMKFCCGKIEGGGCCCGGAHDEDTKKGDVWQ